MEHLTRVKQALDFIERNLREEITVEDVARAAHFSTSHFHLVFASVAGCHVAEHLRKRRLACAALDLALSRQRILDIALEYRFQSQEAFTRAFKRHYGITPGLFRRHRDRVRPRLGIYSPQSVSKGASGMGRQTSRGPAPAEQNGRLVLEGVPYVGFYRGGDQCPEQIPFPSCLAAALRYLGEDYPWLPLHAHNRQWRLNYANVHLLAASGIAFGLLWRDGWHGDNADMMFVADPRDVIRRAFDSTGYQYEIIQKTGSPEDESLYRERIRESVRAGHPVLAFGIIGPPECCLITGYDEGGDVLVGWNYFQYDPAYATGVSLEPSGYFRKRDWFRETHSLIVIGEKQAAPEQTTERETLRWALTIARTPTVLGRHSGLAALGAWAEHVLDDASFATDEADVLRQRHQVHLVASALLAECRAWAGQFLRQMAKKETSMAESLLAAADCYSTEHDLVWEMWALSGGMDDPEAFRRFADPGVRRKTAAIIRQALALDEQAAEHLERALHQ